MVCFYSFAYYDRVYETSRSNFGYEKKLIIIISISTGLVEQDRVVKPQRLSCVLLRWF